MLRSGLRTAILLAGNALHGKGLTAAGRIAAATNAKLFAPYPFTRMERGAGLPAVERINYVLEQAVEQLKEFRQLILVGAAAPVSYFASPGKNSVPTPTDCEIHTLGEPRRRLRWRAGRVGGGLVLRADNAVSRRRQSGPSYLAEIITLPGLAAALGAVLARKCDCGGRIHDLRPRHNARHARMPTT